jgi:uncharacterized protein with FMN-binding domain
VRTATKSAIGILSLGVIAASYTAGTSAQIGFGASTVSDTASAPIEPAPAEPVTQQPIAADSEVENESDSDDDVLVTAPQSPKASAAPAKPTTSTSTAATNPTPTPVATKTAVAVATPTATPTPTKTASTSTNSVAKTGSAINYKYGTIQLEVVKSGSKITSINLIQASTKGREWAAVPSMLVTTAIAAQGSGFGNISGATFSTQAFKSALESALAKF